MLITSLTGYNNNTGASVKEKKKKKEQNIQLFYKRVSFPEGKIYAFTICDKGDVELYK